MRHADPTRILSQLADVYTDLSPRLRRAAEYVLNNPNDVGVNSMRQLAERAAITPNTFVRLARALGYDSYNDFREPFVENLRHGTATFPDRARWLQSLAKGGSHGQLYSQMAAATLTNVEQLFAGSNADEVKMVADRIVASSTTYVLGVGAAYSLAHMFWYIGRMALDNLLHVPRQGNLPIDDIARIGSDDVLLAMTFSPYRADVIAAAKLARRRNATIVAITDSRASPLALLADHVLIAPTSSPQFFPSNAAAFTILETLLAFVIADADPSVIANIESFHATRYEIGVYVTDDD